MEEKMRRGVNRFRLVLAAALALALLVGCRLEVEPPAQPEAEAIEVWSVEVVRDLDNGNALVALKEPERKTVLLDTPWVVWLCEGEAVLPTSSEPPLYTNEHWFKLRSSADQFYAEMKGDLE